MEDPELEEGEACYFKDDDENIDPDIALSYIDEKLQNVLGHHQKDFEGGVSAENLGPKFGGYGSFLPTYQRSPSIRSHPKTPQRVQNFSTPRSPNVLPGEGAPQNSTAPSDAARSQRIGTASCSLPSLQTARVPPVDVSTKQDSFLSSAQVIEKVPLKHETVSNKPVNPTEQRSLKVRIKVGSDNTARKNAAIYCGLGLTSPSSSMGNSPEESGGMPSECQATLNESPNSMLQIMTSFPVPGGLLSPLNESLLCLARNEKVSQNSKLFPAIMIGQEHSAALANDSASLRGKKKEKKETKEKKTKILGKSDNLVVSKREVGTDFDDNRTTLVKREVTRNMESETPGWKQGFSSNTKIKPLTNYACNVVDIVKVAAMASGVPREAGRNESVKMREVINNGMENRLSSGIVKKEILDSMSDQEGGKYEKAEARSSSVEKICERRLKSSRMDISTNPREDDRSKSNKVSAPFKADTDVSMCKRDPNMGAMDDSRHKVGQTDTNHEEDESRMPHGLVKSSSKGKRKSKGCLIDVKPGSEAEERLMAEVYEVPKDKEKAGQIHKSKSKKDIRKARDNYEDLLAETRLEQMNNQKDLLERPFVDRAKDSNLEAVEKKHHVSLEKPKEASTSKKIDNMTSETILKEAANDGHSSAKGGVTSELELNSVAAIVIEEDWVCCDRCQKWRLLPYGTKPEQLPEKWLCSMLNWLPGKNRCDISEEETTKALHALYQLPLPESQNHLPNHVSGTATGAPSIDACHFVQNHLNLSSHGAPNPQKKKQKSKGTPYAASNGDPTQISGSTNDIRQEAVKRRSLNDMNQPLLESNLMSNSNVQNLSKSCNFPVDKNTHKQKEKHISTGDPKQKKPKTKREADQYGHGTTKKIKTEVVFDTDKWTTEHSGNIDRVGRGLPSKVAVKGIEKHDEHYYSKDAKSDWKEKVRISAKKQEERGPVSLCNGSLDMKTCDERDISLKKRKLKDWQESQNYLNTSRNNGNHLPKSKVLGKEESSDSELRKEKKSRVSRTEGKKESSTSKGDARLNRKSKVTRILLSGNKENPVPGRKEVGNIEKDQQPRKYKVKVASKPTSDDLDPLKRDLGSEQFSRTATSSSSKVSDSRKSRTNCPEVKGSPVESVSSSPMRTSNLDKLSLATNDVLEKDAARNDDFPVMDSPRKSLHGEGNVESNRSGTARRGKVSGVFHSEPLGFPVLDFRENNSCQEFGGISKSSVKYGKLENPCSDDLHASDHFCIEDRMNKNDYRVNALFLGKPGKGSSLLSKDQDRSSPNNFERFKVKVSDPPSEIGVLNPKHSLKDEVDTVSHHVALVPEGLSDLCFRIKPTKYEKSGGSRGSEGEVAKRSDPTKSQVLPPHANKPDPSVHVTHSVPGLPKGNAFGVIPVDCSGNDDLSKVVKQHTNAVNHLEYPISNRRGLKDAPSPLRKDGSSHLASNVLKEAENLRDTADRLKDSGFGFECNEAYFQAALKFLHGASLLENCNGDSSKHTEMSPMQIYSTTAKLCETCAHEYGKQKEMAAAALAYKCMEVAYMRVVYCKNSSTNRDRHDLQASLQLVPQGESPSSSASDVDNVNNQAIVDKTALSKGISAHAGNHVIVTHNRPNFVRLLDFTKDVNSAMEASRKSQTAFAAAKIILEEAQNKEGFISVKRVIDFSFQDIEELIRLVRVAIEAISCQKGLGGSKD